MLFAVWDCCALTLFTHKIIAIILNVNIGGSEADTGPRLRPVQYERKARPQATPVFSWQF
jgi:hypothetical protein